jgi:hypothetical protein
MTPSPLPKASVPAIFSCNTLHSPIHRGFLLTLHLPGLWKLGQQETDFPVCTMLSQERFREWLNNAICCNCCVTQRHRRIYIALKKEQYTIHVPSHVHAYANPKFRKDQIYSSSDLWGGEYRGRERRGLPFYYMYFWLF